MEKTIDMALGEQTEKCVGLVVTALDGENADDYIESLKKLIPLVKLASDEEIDILPYPENVKTSFRSDKVLFGSAVTEEKDQVSLLSTLVTYIECQQEGMPQHSREYMDRVTALRHKIDDYYGEKSQQFCGS